MASRASPAKSSFDSLLESNANWFDWIEGAAKFEVALRDKIPWNQLDAVGRGFIQGRLKVAAPERQMLLNSFYMTMVSGFEEYLREKIREATRRYSSLKKMYADVDANVRATHIRESARLLKRLDSPPDHLSLNADELCRGLGSCVPNSQTVLLSPDAFANLESLVLLDSFAKRLSIFGIKCSLDVLGDDKDVKVALKLPRAKPREVAKALEAELMTMRRIRNRIAHAGGNAADVTADLLLAHRTLLRSVTSAIDPLVL